MKIAVLGTGIVGQTIGKKLVELGHDVTMGSRIATNEKAQAWASETGGHAGSFDDAALGSQVIFNCTNGEASLEALGMISPGNIDGKVLIDVANELRMVEGKPVTVASPDNSLAQKIQDAYPKTHVVKSLNTMNTAVMVNPSIVPGYHNVFLSGNNADAKGTARELLESFGWKPHMILDLGGIETAAGAEMLMGLWIALWLSGNGGENGVSNIAVIK